MDVKILEETAKKMMAQPKGILAMDESSPTIAKRLASINTENNEINRRKYRELIVTTPELSSFISGAILFEETFDQKMSDGTLFRDYLKSIGILPGIKVDKGAKDLSCHPNEKITEGLDGLRERLASYYDNGARFCKWRAVITIGCDIPTEACIESNMNALARYASLCQENNLVPIVEPEVLINGSHTIEECDAVTRKSLKSLFKNLKMLNVHLPGTVLKPSMVISGQENNMRADIDTVANMTIDCLSDCVPKETSGIAFLSGGQSDSEAENHLNIMNKKNNLPWRVTFSYARAIQAAALIAWNGDDKNLADAQKVLMDRANRCSKASVGKL
jgi:fructose-bisphosphate aldolase class I